ncbi:MFS transporter [Sedimenticola hydrogenitrophicus]|uniref:MFS transporter n=1 Tax=Sedimenticola hydrogenitrophicus TaxID=2967975 RepID=UPI0023AF7DA6|nr:MFS transporter [Sedimenticola hydrogenitrophicus]
MTPTILILLSGLGLLLVGVGLLGTLLGVRATLASFSNIEIGLIMAGYYAGYIVGTLTVPGVIRNVGHIRSFAAFAAVGAAASLAFGLLVHPWVWLVLRVLSGLCVVGLYMVVESWLNAQSAGPVRGRIFSLYMMSTLVALGAGQLLLLAGDTTELTLFALAAILISLGVVPVALARVHEPTIEKEVSAKFTELMRMTPLGFIGALIAGVVNGVFWGMTPVFGQRLELGDGQIAMLMSATIFGGAILQWPIGHLSDRIDRRTVLTLTSLATAAVAAVTALIVIRGYPGLTVSAFLHGGLMFSLYGISVAYAYDHLAPGQVLETTRGLLLIYGIGALSGPLLAGIAMDLIGPVGLPVVSATSAGILALFGLYRMSRRSAIPVAEQTVFVPMVRTSPLVLEMHPDVDPAPELDLAGRE